MWTMFPKVFYQLILPKLYLENIENGNCQYAFHWDISLALAFRTITTLILRGLQLDIPVYSNYAGRKHQHFE